MESGLPLVSIGMPVYNGERFLKPALDSLLAQSHTNLEIIISDNGSTDSTEAICRDYASQDQRIHYSRQALNIGVVSNFNKVLNMASGEYFMWAACDDAWEPGFVSSTLAALLATPGATLAFSAFDNIDDLGQPVRQYPHIAALSSRSMTRFDQMWRYLAQPEQMGKANLIYGLTTTSILRSAGGFSIWGRRGWGSDMHTVFRILSFGNLVLIPELLFHKRLVVSAQNSPVQHPQSVMTGIRRGILRWADRTDYLYGYMRLIRANAKHSFPEKMALYALVFGRGLSLLAGDAGRTIRHFLK